MVTSVDEALERFRAMLIAYRNQSVKIHEQQRHDPAFVSGIPSSILRQRDLDRKFATVLTAIASVLHLTITEMQLHAADVGVSLPRRDDRGSVVAVDPWKPA